MSLHTAPSPAQRSYSRQLLPGAVCGTDGKTYESLCQLKETACRLVRRQGELEKYFTRFYWNISRPQFPVNPADPDCGPDWPLHRPLSRSELSENFSAKFLVIFQV